MAILLLSTGILATRSGTSGPVDETVDVVTALAPLQPLHTSLLEKVDVLPPADSLSIMRFLLKEALKNPRQASLLPPTMIDEETLWLSRAIYSESKRPEEQELVAWTIRNRVETAYRGQTTYEGVVLDPYQFSAFNPNMPNRDYYMELDVHTPDKKWQRALSIAFHVRHADDDLRPFSIETRHFYSERSMVGRAYPEWAKSREPIQPSRHEIDERRFRFYSGIF